MCLIPLLLLNLSWSGDAMWHELLTTRVAHYPRLIWYHWYVTYFALLMHSISIHNDNITSYRYIVFKTTDFSVVSPKTFMRQYHLFSRISPNLPRHRTKKGKKWKEKCIVIHPHRTSWDVKKIIEGKKEWEYVGEKDKGGNWREIPRTEHNPSHRNSRDDIEKVYVHTYRGKLESIESC